MGRDRLSFIGIVCVVGLFVIVGFIIGERFIASKAKIKQPSTKQLISKGTKTTPETTTGVATATPPILTPTPMLTQPTTTLPATPTQITSPKKTSTTTQLLTKKYKAPTKLATKQYCIQVFATKDKDKANIFLGFLFGRNLEAQITTRDDWYLVRILGSDLDKLKGEAEKLVKEGYIKNFFVILPEERPSKEEKISKVEGIGIAQVFSSTNFQAAVNLEERLKLLGYSVKLHRVEIANTPWYRVYITGKHSWLQNELDKLKEQGYIQEYRFVREVSKEEVQPMPTEPSVKEKEYTIEVGSWRSKALALKKVNQLRQLHYPAYMYITKNKVFVYSVRVGKFSDEKKAAAFAQDLKDKGIIDNFTIK